MPKRKKTQFLTKNFINLYFFYVSFIFTINFYKFKKNKIVFSSTKKKISLFRRLTTFGKKNVEKQQILKKKIVFKRILNIFSMLIIDYSSIFVD